MRIHRLLPIRHVAYCLSVLLPLLSQALQAQPCNEAQELEHTFDSGAKWSLCWRIDNVSGLSLNNIAYQAPGQPLTNVIASASIAQIIKHYDADTSSSSLLPTPGLGGQTIKHFINGECSNGELLQHTDGMQLCKRVRDVNNLTRVRNTQSKRRHELALYASSLIDGQTIEQVWRLSEDGEITPMLRFSGTIARYTSDSRYGVKVNQNELYAASASILVSWRIAFAINGDSNNDKVVELEFAPAISDVVKRPMLSTPISVETHRKTMPQNFRAWLVSDATLSAGTDNVTRMGYLFDPQSHGYQFRSQSLQWPNFDISFSNLRSCEYLASNNSLLYEACGDSIDNYVNNDTIESPVFWINTVRRYTPSFEDYPAMRTLEASFKLIPFDWSPYTTFSTEPTQ